VLSTPGHDNRTYDITGPALLGVADIAAAATAATGKVIRVSPAGPNDPPPRGFAGPTIAFTSTAVADLTGHPATPLATVRAANRQRLLG
jgi:uncharacterized protein YbjT (DUF2867 family)